MSDTHEVDGSTPSGTTIMKSSQHIIALGETLDKKYSKPIYYGVFLDDDSRDQLKRWWVNTVGSPLLPEHYCHHMTVKFKPSPEEVESYQPLIGSKVSVKVVGFAEDEKGQAVLVSPQEVQSANANPHITVSCAPGTAPVYSNTLLAGGVTPIDGPVLTGVFDQHPRSF